MTDLEKLCLSLYRLNEANPNMVTYWFRRLAEQIAQDEAVRSAPAKSDVQRIDLQPATVEQDGLMKNAPFGPSNVNGKLFFKLLDGGVLTCECLGEPFVTQVIEACRYASEMGSGRDHS